MGESSHLLLHPPHFLRRFKHIPECHRFTLRSILRLALANLDQASYQTLTNLSLAASKATGRGSRGLSSVGISLAGIALTGTIRLLGFPYPRWPRRSRRRKQSILSTLKPSTRTGLRILCADFSTAF